MMEIPYLPTRTAVSCPSAGGYAAANMTPAAIMIRFMP
jgi:hypothetical protein